MFWGLNRLSRWVCTFENERMKEWKNELDNFVTSLRMFTISSVTPTEHFKLFFSFFQTFNLKIYGSNVAAHTSRLNPEVYISRVLRLKSRNAHNKEFTWDILSRKPRAQKMTNLVSHGTLEINCDSFLL